MQSSHLVRILMNAYHLSRFPRSILSRQFRWHDSGDIGQLRLIVVMVGITRKDALQH